MELNFISFWSDNSSVNVNRIKLKLPSLLCDSETGNRFNDNMFMRYRYRLQQFQKDYHEKFNSLIFRLLTVLEDFDKEISKNIN